MRFRLVVTCAAVFMAVLLWTSCASAQGFCFSTASNYPADSNPQSVVAADLDGDGDQDLAVANYDAGNVSVLKNNGNGTYAAAVNYAVGTNPNSVFAADLDGDGDRDLAVANSGGGTVSVLKNNGSGTYAAAVNYAVGSNPRSVFAADLDGDGDRDLAVANQGSGSISVLKNNGNGTYALAVHYPGFNSRSSVFAADLDGDGDRDLAVTNNNVAKVSVQKNNGDGTFASAVDYTIGGISKSVFVADLDGDGDLDLAVANLNNMSVSVLKNTGNGTYGAAVNFTVGSFPASVYAADFDGDGDLDLAVANDLSSNVSVLRNNGDGTYGAAVNYPAGARLSSVIAGDLDGDGDQDLVAASWTTNNVSVLKNCLPIAVYNLGNSGAGSLRAAIDWTNINDAAGGLDSIIFMVAGVISLSSPLPSLMDLSGGTVIDGLTAPGAAPGSPTVILDGALTTGRGLSIDSPGNLVRGLEIRGFSGPGIEVGNSYAQFNTLSDNRIYGNGGPGIDLGNNGITLNDIGDVDNGPNDLLNYPVFDSVIETGPDTFTVYGTAAPFSRVEMFLASEAWNASFPGDGVSHGPAYRLLGAATAGATGPFSFGPIAKPEWSEVTATATDPLGNTSEFAKNRLLTPDPLRITAYSEPVVPLLQIMSLPMTSPAMQIVVFSPPNSLDLIDSIGPTFNTFGSRATYTSVVDYNNGGIVDTRVTIISPDTGTYRIVYILIGDPGDYLTGIGIDGHAEAQQAVSFNESGQTASVTFVLARPARGELTGDGAIDVFDIIKMIDVIFSGAPEPRPPELLDVNCSGAPDVFDVIDLIDYTFSGGPPPCK